MKPIVLTPSGYFAIAALIIATMAFSTPHANAASATGRDDNPGQAKGQAANGGPASPGVPATPDAAAKGRLTAALGSLNAAHASPKAFKNANERSRVGALAAYMEAMSSYSTNLSIYNQLMDEISAVEAEIGDLSDMVAALDPEDPEYEAKLAELGDKIAMLEGHKDALEDDADGVSGSLAASAGDAAESLGDAANKDRLIDASVVDAVNRMLDGKSADFTHSGAVHDAEGSIAILINSQ